MQVAAARLAAHFSVLADELAAEESGLHPGGQLQTLEGRIALRRFRLRGAHRPGLARVDQGEVGIEAFGDVAFRVRAEAARGVRARQRRDPVVAQYPPASL